MTPLKSLKFILIALLIPITASATDIAECANPAGRTYFPQVGGILAKNSGWVDDSIKDGITRVTLNDKGEFDIVFIDSMKRFISTRGDGGHVSVFASGSQSFGLVVLYPGKVIETYTFFKTNANKYEYLHTTSRAGDAVSIAKSSLLRGACSFINLDGLKRVPN